MPERIDAHAVENAEVDDLGAPSHLAVYLFFGHPKNARCDGAVHIFPRLENFNQLRVARENRRDAKLNLRIINRNESKAPLGDERTAYF